MPIEPDVQAGASMTDDSLRAAIQQALAQEQQAGVSQQPVINAPSPVVQADGQAQPAQEPAPVGQVEPKSEGVAAEELMRKKGMTSIDDIAKSYSEIEKKMSQIAQENARLRQQVPMAQPNFPQYPPMDAPPPVPQQPAYDPNRQFLESFAQNPLETLAVAFSTLNKPLIEQQRDVAFKNELVRLSSSPKTADFNLPEVQGEIQKVIEERPQMYLDRFGKVAPDRLEDLYYLAKGRLSVVGGQPQAQGVVNKFSPVEGANIAPQPQVKSIEQMTNEELKALIQQKLNQGL